MPTLLRTLAADADVRNIAYQIGVEDGRPATAERVIDELLDCCQSLAEHSPRFVLGTPLPQLGLDVRGFSYRRWVILFRYTDNGVLILRIADGRQDYLAWSLGD